MRVACGFVRIVAAILIVCAMPLMLIVPMAAAFTMCILLPVG